LLNKLFTLSDYRYCRRT